MPVVVYAGDEEFTLSRSLDELKKKLVDPTWASMNYLRLEAPPLSTVIEQAAALPFGPGNKVIVIDKCDLFTKKRGKGGETEADEPKGKGKTNELDRFDEALASVADNTFLIFACPFNFDKTLKTSKVIVKYAKMTEFPKEKYFPGSRNPNLETWCSKEAHRFGASIDDEASLYLMEGLEANLRAISSEIQKAATKILPAKHITLATIIEISPHQSHVFALAESWVQGKGKDSLTSLKELLSGQPAMPVIAAMQTILGKWLTMKALCEKYNSDLPSAPGVNRRELPLSELAKRVSTETKAHPFAVEKDLKRIAKLPLQRLIEKREQLTKFEDLVKTGQIPDHHALELFLVS